MNARSLILLQALLALSANAADDPSDDVSFMCDAKNQNAPLVMIALHSEPLNPQIEYQRSLGRRIEHIDPSPLIRHSANGLRTGSASVQKICGPITVTISAGYLNANAAGQSGYGDFPVISATMHGKPLLPSTAIGACHASEQKPWGRCPEDWADLIQIYGRGNTANIRLVHVFSETRNAP